MEESYLLACTQYVELNPVQAGLVKKPEEWKWSIPWSHIKDQDDIMVNTKPLLEIVQSFWKDFLSIDINDQEIGIFKKHDCTGLPLGENVFIEALEFLLSRQLKPKKPGPKKRDK